MICKFILFICLLYNSYNYAQNQLAGTVTDEHSGEHVIGVNVIVLNTNIGTATDTEGNFTLSGIPGGKQTIRFSHIGYEQYEIELEFPYTSENLFIELESESEELEEVYVNATRSSRTIDA